MKRLIFGSLSLLLMSAATAPAIKAQPPVSGSSRSRSRSLLHSIDNTSQSSFLRLSRLLQKPRHSQLRCSPCRVPIRENYCSRTCPGGCWSEPSVSGSFIRLWVSQCCRARTQRSRAKVEKQMYVIHYELDLVMRPNPPLRLQKTP